MSERKTNIAANSIEHSELYRLGELICYGAYLFKTFEIYDEYTIKKKKKKKWEAAVFSK